MHTHTLQSWINDAHSVVDKDSTSFSLDMLDLIYTCQRAKLFASVLRKFVLRVLSLSLSLSLSLPSDEEGFRLKYNKLNSS